MSVEATGVAISEPTLRRGVVRTLLRNPLTVAALVVLALFVIVAALQPWIMPFSPNYVQLSLTNAPPFTTEYFLGGDKYGRDILSRLIASTRGAMEATIVLAIVAFLIGVTTGLVAGYFGRAFDVVSGWVFSVIMAVPGVILLVSLYTLLGTSTTVAMAVFGVLISPGMFWMVRTLTRSVRNELYVDAARVSGLSDLRIVSRHVLTAIRAPVILMTASLAGAGVGVQAGLEFLGLGNPGEASWGAMLNDAFANIYIAPEQLIWPAAVLGLVTSAFTLISIGLRDTLEGTFVKPSRRAREREVARVLATATPDAGQAERPAPRAPTGAGDEPLLVVEDLRVAYAQGDRVKTVVGGVSLTVEEGEIVGIVGESGSGKTQTVFAALGLLPDEAIVAGGSVRLDGVELLGMPTRQRRRYRGRAMAYVPQEPTANLDPSFTVGAQMVFALRAQLGGTRREARELALRMLDRVGISDPPRVFSSYPHQISGGMAQRVLIASAVACEPRLLVADEPTTALDVTIQAEVLDLLRDLQRQHHMGVLIVTHNFGVVADLCDRVIVMRDGEIVEAGAVADVFGDPQHQYTRMLLGAVLDDAALRVPVRMTEDACD